MTSRAATPARTPPKPVANADAPIDHATRTEQRVIDDQGGGTGLPTEARDSPVGTPIGGPVIGSTGVRGGATGQTRGGDPG